MTGATKRRAHTLLRAFGVDVVRYTPALFRELRWLATIRALRIDLVLDVGANAGQWARAARRHGYQGRLVSFEPLSSAFAALEVAAAGDPLWEVHNLALGDADGVASMNIAGNSWSSSLLGMMDVHLDNAPHSGYVGTEEVVTARLDSIHDEVIRSSQRVFLKLDVQGYELRVLEGAERTMTAICAVETELSFVELYSGQPLLPEVVAHLHALSYDLTSVEVNFETVLSGAPLQADGLFLRRPS